MATSRSWQRLELALKNPGPGAGPEVVPPPIPFLRLSNQSRWFIIRRQETQRWQRIVIDFSSPNAAKPATHVGHIATILATACPHGAFLANDVITDNHVGDQKRTARSFTVETLSSDGLPESNAIGEPVDSTRGQRVGGNDDAIRKCWEEAVPEKGSR
jgi:hypothetical protein